MNIYSNFISDIYAVLSGDYEQYFVPIDTVLEEVPSNLDYIIRPSFYFGTSVSYTNLRYYEDDSIINLQIFKNHDSNVDIVEVALDVQNKLKDLTSFVYEGWKFSITSINLLKNYDSRYTGVTVQLISRKLEQVEEEPIDWTTRPLTFIAAEPNTKIIIRRYGTGIISTSIKYKFNINDEWQNYTPGDEITLAKIGDMVMFENTNTTRLSFDTANYFNVESIGSFYARGQINSLSNYQQPYNYSFYKLFEDCEGILSTPIFPSGTLVAHVYDSMFKGCSNLVEAESLIVPTYVNDSHCINMFRDCTSLKDVKKIVFNSLGASTCYSMFMNCASLKYIDITFPETTNTNAQRSMFQGCTNLRKAPELPATSTAGYCYQDMFRGCINLKETPELKFTNAAVYCCQNMFNGCIKLESGPIELLPERINTGGYDGMFYGCTNLKAAPIIHANSVGSVGCRNMFRDCTSLITTPPVLSAMTIENDCYNCMFHTCSNITSVPDLPATTLATNCYYSMFTNCKNIESIKIYAESLANNSCQNMFNGCTNLNNVEVHFNAWNPSIATSQWMSNVQTVSGIFKCPSALPDERGVARIPVNWTKVDIN